MGQAAHSHDDGDHSRGGMDIADQKGTFDGFMSVTVWSCALIAMGVAGLTVAFAMGAGWFAGVGVYAAVGVAIGLLMRMGGVWWASLIGTVVLFVIGGGVVSGLGALMGG
jgi:Bacterial aa3 type cytochrome c oxidase subunit IV